MITAPNNDLIRLWKAVVMIAAGVKNIIDFNVAARAYKHMYDSGSSGISVDTIYFAISAYHTVLR